MKMTSMKSVIQKLAFPLLAGGMLWSGNARADVNGDITSIKSDRANAIVTASGDTIDFKISLAGKFVLTNTYGGTLALLPEIRMVVNGDMAFATLHSLSQYKIANGTVDRTDAIFRYTVKPGDMAQPMKIYGSTTIPYQFYWNSWEIVSATNNAVQPVWKFNASLSWPNPPESEVYDLDLAKANITIKTLAFDETDSETSVAAKESGHDWRVTTVNPVSTTVVDFYVWTTGTNVLQIGNIPNQTAQLYSMATGATFLEFPIKGLAVGTADVYLQRTKDYLNNATLGVTNFIKRTITITAPPSPYIQLIMSETGTDNVTLNETNALNTGKFKVELSEAYSNDVYVQVNLAPLPQPHVTFNTSPLIVVVPKNQTLSSEQNFNVPDGTVTSMWGVTLSPVITNTAAASYYTDRKTATVYVQNVKPSVTATYTPPAARGIPCTFMWSAKDVAADMNATMNVQWNLNGETVTNVSGATGSMLYTFATTGTKTITVVATDKDGLQSDPYVFTVVVDLPVPKPSVRLVPTATTYDETTTNNTGSLTITLSESYAYDVWVQLTTTLQGLAQSNIVFATTNAVRIAQGLTNSAPISFSIPDGTLETEIYGIDIVPTVTNAPANGYFTDLRQTTVFVKNVRPTVTKPVAVNPALTPLPQYTNVPLGRPFTFDYTVKDVSRDLSGMIVQWRFGDGTPDLVVTGAVGTVTHTYGSLGQKTVWMQATDKDTGASEEIEFPVMVVPPPPPPSVRILPPAGPLMETTSPNTGAFTVQLTEAFTNLVYVKLVTTPVNSPVNGTVTLATNQVMFAVGEVEKQVKFSAADGTAASWGTGFEVTPQVVGLPSATNHYKDVVPGTIILINNPPVIKSPTSTTTYTIPKGTPFTFNWAVTDVPADSKSSPLSEAMRIDWDFGDGYSETRYGASGTISHTYTTTGEDITVVLRATDKDGDTSEVLFKVTVKPAKEVVVTPIGPNIESDYYGAPRRRIGSPDGTAGGIGDGMVFSSVVPVNRNNVYFFSFSPGVSSATLEAVPYKVNPLLGYYNVTNFNNAGVAVPDPTEILYDSFFFVWVGADQGFPAAKLDPATTTSATTIALPNGTTDTESVEIRDVQAIFSREWLQTDNVGDINADGIPDKVANKIWASIGVETTEGGDTTTAPNWLKPLNTYNDDLDKVGGTAVGDFLPINPNGIGGLFDFRPVADANIGSGGLPANAFIAFREVRGFERGLNGQNSDPDGNQDEPGTDPTLADTDGDSYPDGWEYWFWYQANFSNMVGEAYSAADVGQGTFIKSKVISDTFEPAVAGSDGDLDNDGLRNVEELTIGSNPTHWDTDRDGMADGWEVMQNLNPMDSRDAATNPDGDYMASASVPRQYVTAVTGGVTTNFYLAVGADIASSNGTFTTVYHYGNSNAVIAVGRSIQLPADAVVIDVVETNALIMHFQVFHQFGFDPRTAWINAMNYRTDYVRFPEWINEAPNTQPFTSLDEYLLLKVMAETRMNGNTGLVAPAVAEWQAYSTHPRTPDSDANLVTAEYDGMPDGWELYVGLADPADTTLGISPWNFLDGAGDNAFDGDGLMNSREFAGTESSAAYAKEAYYTVSTNAAPVVTITRPAVDATWVNKFWPTNPWNEDTDGDGLADGAENTFIYIPNATPVQDSHGICTQGGGLNPNAMDTDYDALPDHWENTFAGTSPAAGAFTGMVISNGMDGTFADAFQDWDADGLQNYQEYWVQAARHFRYDITADGTVNRFGVPGVPLNANYEAYMLFTPVTNTWDLSRLPWGETGPSLWVLLPIGASKLYACTDPVNFDTDFDSMDDFYELFHGLNPILGEGIRADLLDDRVARAYVDGGRIVIDWGSVFIGNDWGNGLPSDFISYPWLNGKPTSDPDADGLLNLEEQLLANSAAPANYNTDPTPLWITDAANPNSYMCFYTPGLLQPMFFWPPPPPLPDYMFNFEMNEGYDTDNDGISDKAELVDSRNAQSSPQDHDDPVRRQALWFSGMNSAASTMSAYGNVNIQNVETTGDAEWSFRSFTVELWARPEVTNSHQVLIERAFVYGPSDASTPGAYIRRNFRIGIAEDGRLYAGFDNPGADTHDSHTATVMDYGNRVIPNEWIHIVARMSGLDQSFTLFVNGEIRSVVETALIPANGTVVVRDDPLTNTREITTMPGTLVLGAANNMPLPVTDQIWEFYDKFYRGYIDEVRIWDGARNIDAIQEDYKNKKRYTYADLMKNRETIASQIARGYTRDLANTQQLAPLLMNHYTFDNLFGADRASSVATSPRGFMDPAVAINRPLAPEDAVGWWSSSAVRSTVYNNYAYVPWIENGYEHLPLFGGVTTVDGAPSVLMTRFVRDSVYWTETSAGTTNVANTFPNHNNPYGVYFDCTPGTGGMLFNTDLLPLGDAFAKQAEALWDGDGPAESWLETGVDSDSDGLADWWEMDRYGDLAHGWNDLYTLDNMQLTNGQRYQRDLAKGATESNPAGGGIYAQTADTDGDGLPDWWEKLFNLRADVAAGRDGAGGDPDRDGLSNLAEYWITEVYGFRYVSPLLPVTLADQNVTDYFVKQGTLTFGAMFSDHDFITDSWEDLYGANYVNRFVYDAHQDNDIDGWSNWSESRYFSDPTRNMHLDPEGQSAKDFPVPMLKVSLAYSGIQQNANLVVNAYADPAMDGVPDAVFSVAAPSAAGTPFTKSFGFWSPRTIKGFLSPGSVNPGSIAMTFTDVSPDAEGISVDVVFDVYTDLAGLTGKIMGVDGSGWEEEIGTIDYVTGEYTIDLAWFTGTAYSVNVSATEWYTVHPESSYMKITYNAAQVSGWPKTVYLSDPDQGYLLEGTNYFFAFMDLNANGAWDAGEPCGVPNPVATDINWDFNAITIQLTDYTPGYLRMTLQPGMRSEDVYTGAGGDDAGAGGGTDGASSALESRVQVIRSRVDNSTQYQMQVLDKTIAGRNYLHEGDLLAKGVLGLDWGLATVPVNWDRTLVVYDVYVGTSAILTNNTKVLSFTNTFDAVQAKATAVAPAAGAYVYSSRPVFRWKMPEAYTAFALEIRKGSSVGPLIYQTGETQAPVRNDVNGDCIWEAPIHANNKLPNGQTFAANTVYAWRVVALNPKFTLALSSPGAWSDWKMFRLDVNAPMSSSGYGEIKSVVKYLGPVTNLSGRVKVQVFNTRGFTGVPVAQYTMTDAEVGYLTTPATTNVNAVLRGLLPSSTAGSYYVRAYIDQNQNNVRDVWESWGYANYYGTADQAYDVRPFEVAFSTLNPTATIYIEDTDTDQDWFPDAWEYQVTGGNSNFLNMIGPSSDWDGTGDTEVNPALQTSGPWQTMSIFSALALGTTDLDGDGLDDMMELLLGANAASASTASDGYTDSDKISLGLSPSDLLSLGVTGLGVSPSAASVQWQLNVKRSTAVDRAYLSSLSGVASDGTVRYYVEHTPSLLNPAWTVVETGTVALEGTQNKLDQIDKQALESSATGFFRVRLVPVAE